MLTEEKNEIEGSWCAFLPSLNRTFTRKDISMALTKSGLLVSRAECLVDLYRNLLDWEAVREEWHEKRLGGRGSRESSQGIFKLLRNRLQAHGRSLPSPDALAPILYSCRNPQEKAQVLFLYAIEEDKLLKYAINELLRRSKIVTLGYRLDIGTLSSILDDFRYKDGGSLDYSGSTLKRWTQGLRSVLLEIGVRKAPYSDEGNPPTLERIPLLIGAGYSWAKEGRMWQERPVGWAYLFQSYPFWPPLTRRLYDEPTWVMRSVGPRQVLEPREGPFCIDLEGNP